MIIVIVATAATAAIMMVFFLSSEELLFFCGIDPSVVAVFIDKEVFGFILLIMDSDFGTVIVFVVTVAVVVVVVDVLVANRVIGS